MTRKDYILIAEALRQARQHTSDQSMLDGDDCEFQTGIKSAAASIADALAADNARFDRDRFMRAALGDSHER